MIDFRTFMCLALAAVAVAGCGSQAGAGTTANGSQQHALAFARCMRSHGVNVPDPGAGGQIQIQGAKPDDPSFQAAQRACGHLLQAKPISPQDQARFLAAGRRFAACMRAHGIDVPDPKAQGGGIEIQAGGPRAGGVNPNSPAFQSAQQQCQRLLPKPGGGTATFRAGGPPQGGAVPDSGMSVHP